MGSYDTQPIKKIEIDYNSISFLSPIIKDYLNEIDQLSPFYKYPPSIKSFKQVIADKQKQTVDRVLLTGVITRQYQGLEHSKAVQNNIKLLKDNKTFTITTAHQPNIFSGFLYLVYKVIGAINTAELLKDEYPGFNFVPVYWMGSEDHDFEEINHVYLHGEKLEWQTNQTGAVGRMDVNAILPLINQIAALLHGRPHTDELIKLLKESYSKPTLAEANKYLINALFGEFGLVVINQDDAQLKQPFVNIIKGELLDKVTEKVVNKTINQLSELQYKIQAKPREINLFYLTDDFRERIVWNDDTNEFEVLNTKLSFSPSEINEKLETEPEKFSPNVFLRPLYQEIVLPNLGYIGGGGELAYWLELKGLFEHFDVNYPMLLLRNSVLLIDKVTQKKIDKLGLSLTELFEKEEDLIKIYVRENSEAHLDLTIQKIEIKQLYQSISNIVNSIDPTLEKTVNGQLQSQLNALEVIEKKMIRAEKRNFEVATNQIKAVKKKLFPNVIPQERFENFMPYYTQYGHDMFNMLKDNLNSFSKEMTLINLD